MNITVKLYATLGNYLPSNAQRNAIPFEIESGATADTIIRAFHLPRDLVHLVLVNGQYISPEDWVSCELNPNDVIAMWPPVAGG